MSPQKYFLSCVLDRLERDLDPAIWQSLLLDSIDLSSGQWADLHSETLERVGVGWDLSLELYAILQA